MKMKKISLLLIIAVLLVGNVFAQGIYDQPADQPGGQRQRDGQRQRPDDSQQRQRDGQRQRPDNAPQRGDQQRPDRPELQAVSVTGTLQLENGYIVLASGDNIYHVSQLRRLVGFIDGLKEGKEVSVEGFENKTSGSRKFIHLTKLTVDGKSYDFRRQDAGDFRGPPPGGPGRNQYAPGGGYGNRDGYHRGYDHRGRGGHHNKHDYKRGRGYRGCNCCGWR